MRIRGLVSLAIATILISACAPVAGREKPAETNGAGTTTNTVKPAAPRPASTPTIEERSQFAEAEEAFLDSARTLVRKARDWNRDALEQLFHALGQIETSLRDGGLKARAAS